MKYSSEELNAMSYLEWMETIANELNEAGFRGPGYSEVKKRFVNHISPYKVRDVDYFFMGSINDSEAMDYLKSIGLVNNGRCPMCGDPIKGTPSRFTSGMNADLNFHICSSCRKGGQSMSVNHAGTGCIVALALMPWHLLKSIFSNLF